jgi:hypothetical protein
MLYSAYDLQESMEYSEFRLVMEEAQQWVEQKQNDSLAPNKYDPTIKDFMENTWDSFNDSTLPHGDSDELQKDTKDPTTSPDKMVVHWSSCSISETILLRCLESYPNLHKCQ